MKRLMVCAALALMAACADAPEPATEEAAEAPKPIDTAAVRIDAALDAPGGLPPSKDTTVAPGTVGAATASTNVLIEIGETGAKLSHPTIAPGQITLVMENKGTQNHQLEVSNPHGGRWRTMQAPPNGEVSVTMVLGRGTYDVFCPMTHGGKPHRQTAATKLEVQ